jgi:hypothetical protein
MKKNIILKKVFLFAFIFLIAGTLFACSDPKEDDDNPDETPIVDDDNDDDNNGDNDDDNNGDQPVPFQETTVFSTNFSNVEKETEESQSLTINQKTWSFDKVTIDDDGALLKKGGSFQSEYKTSKLYKIEISAETPKGLGGLEISVSQDKENWIILNNFLIYEEAEENIYEITQSFYEENNLPFENGLYVKVANKEINNYENNIYENDILIKELIIKSSNVFRVEDEISKEAMLTLYHTFFDKTKGFYTNEPEVIKVENNIEGRANVPLLTYNGRVDFPTEEDTERTGILGLNRNGKNAFFQIENGDDYDIATIYFEFAWLINDYLEGGVDTDQPLILKTFKLEGFNGETERWDTLRNLTNVISEEYNAITFEMKTQEIATKYDALRIIAEPKTETELVGRISIKNIFVNVFGSVDKLPHNYYINFGENQQFNYDPNGIEFYAQNNDFLTDDLQMTFYNTMIQTKAENPHLLRGGFANMSIGRQSGNNAIIEFTVPDYLDVKEISFKYSLWDETSYNRLDTDLGELSLQVWMEEEQQWLLIEDFKEGITHGEYKDFYTDLTPGNKYRIYGETAGREVRVTIDNIEIKTEYVGDVE